MKRFSRSEVKVKVFGVQMCECYDGGGTCFDGVANEFSPINGVSIYGGNAF